MEYKTYSGSLYGYTAGVHVGVLVTEPVMKKLAKLQAKHLESVKRLLSDSEGEVFPSMWTLHYPNGKQTQVKYIETSSDLSESISLATTGNKPVHHPLVFIASGMEEAEKMANARFEEVGV